MKTLQRYYLTNCLYFVTAVTHQRQPILDREPDLFHKAWRDQKLLGWVLLPDHLHAILHPQAGTISDVIHHFKIVHSRAFRDRHRPGRVWQNRFWDHVIRDENDLRRHLDYIHYNPVKHGLVSSAQDYRLSSLASFVRDGLYSPDWGTIALEFDGEFGE